MPQSGKGKLRGNAKQLRHFIAAFTTMGCDARAEIGRPVFPPGSGGWRAMHDPGSNLKRGAGGAGRAGVLLGSHMAASRREPFPPRGGSGKTSGALWAGPGGGGSTARAQTARESRGRGRKGV